MGTRPLHLRARDLARSGLVRLGVSVARGDNLVCLARNEMAGLAHSGLACPVRSAADCRCMANVGTAQAWGPRDLAWKARLGGMELGRARACR